MYPAHHPPVSAEPTTPAAKAAPRIFYFTPYHPGGLGQAYNDCCAIVPNDDDWICLMDSDIMFFSSQRYGEQIAEAITKHPEFDVFTCVTNRMCGDQQIRGPIRMERDLVKLKLAADQRSDQFRGSIQTIHGFFAGYFICFPKRLWKEIPFPTIGSQGGKLLGIDSAWSHSVHRAGKKVGLLLGLMAVHFYRLDTGEGDVSHLSDAGHNPNRPHVYQSPKGGSTNGPEPTAPPQRIRLNPHLYPPSGYFIIDEDEVEHRAPSADALVRNLLGHRARLGKPPGNPMRELLEQIYKRHPEVCVLE